jgi:biotin carboxylase
MNKTLLVLAAARYQLDTIRSAKRLGHRVITLDNRPENPGHREADESYNIDTTDMEAVLEVARHERIDGVIAACTDVAVPTAAFVARELHLAGPPLESTRIVCSKIRFREFLGRHNFPVPQSFPIDSSHKPDAALFENGRWIMKPDQSSGSKGIFVVRSRAEFSERLPQTLSFSPTDTGILEEFIEGHQGTCEGILRHGELALTCVSDRMTPDPPFVATRGHYLPSRLPAAKQEMLFSSLRKVWKLLQVTEGPFDCDFVATGDAVYLLEISPRMGGNCISSLMRQALDFDIVEYSIREALGEDPEPPAISRIRPTAAIILGVADAGLLAFDQSEEQSLKREPWVHSLWLDVDYGTPVQPFINGRHRVGEAIVLGKDRDDVDAKVAELYRRLRLRARKVSMQALEKE